MTRDDDLARVSREVAARLAALGIALDGHEVAAVSRSARVAWSSRVAAT